ASRVVGDVEVKDDHAAFRVRDTARSLQLTALRRLVPRLQLGAQWIAGITTCSGDCEQGDRRRRRGPGNGAFHGAPLLEQQVWEPVKAKRGPGVACAKTYRERSGRCDAASLGAAPASRRARTASPGTCVVQAQHRLRRIPR